MTAFLADLRYGARMLRKNPGFTTVAVLTLALGLSANTSIFGIISAFFFQPLPVKDPERLVMVLQKSSIWKLPHGHSWLDYQDFKERVPEFSDALALFMAPIHFSAPGQEPERTWMEAVSGNYFSMLGVQAAQGRLLLPTEGRQPGADPVVVLSHAYWQRKFGADPGIVGKTVNLNGHPFTVVGVTPPKFNGAQWSIAPSLWVPATMVSQCVVGGENFLKSRGAVAFKVLARLKPGATLAQARASVEVVAKRLAAEYPKEHRESTLIVRPEIQCRPEPSFCEFMPFAAVVFMGMVFLVLAIGCANVANLMFSRALVRQKEMGIRAAIGASRWQLIRQLLAESLLLSFLAGLVGLVIAQWSGRLLQQLTPSGDLPLQQQQGWDWRVFVFTLLMSLVAGVLTGIAPARRATRLDVQTILKEGGGDLLGSGRHPFRSGLVIGQVAICLIILVCGGLFVQSLRQMARFDLGFRTENLVMASLDLGLQGYTDDRGRQFCRQLADKVRALPGVRGATIGSSVPFDYGVRLQEVGAQGQVNLQAPAGKDGLLTAGINVIDETYLATLGVTLLRGRDFTSQDTETAPRVAIINQTLAQKLWPGQEALGKRLCFGRQGDLIEVVGVARDGKYVMLGEERRPFLYVPFAQHYTAPVTLHVRTVGDPLALAPAVRAVLAELDPHLPIYNVRTMSEHVRTSFFGLMPLRTGAYLAGAQGLLGLVLAVMGIYGVVAYVVSQRTREIGIRMALGARPRDVLRLVIREGLHLTLIGVGIGLVLALGLAQLLARLLYGLNPLSLPVFGSVLALLIGVALLACYLPARRATRVDPVVALRYE